MSALTVVTEMIEKASLKQKQERDINTFFVTAIAASSTLAAGASHASTLAGTYDGYCDGFSLTLSKNGAAYGVETGCDSGAIAGAKVKGAVVFNEPHVGNTVFKLDTTAHTWTIYTTSGGILKHGTYTPAPASGAVRDLSGLRPTGTR